MPPLPLPLLQNAGTKAGARSGPMPRRGKHRAVRHRGTAAAGAGGARAQPQRQPAAGDPAAQLQLLQPIVGVSLPHGACMQHAAASAPRLARPAPRRSSATGMPSRCQNLLKGMLRAKQRETTQAAPGAALSVWVLVRRRLDAVAAVRRPPCRLLVESAWAPHAPASAAPRARPTVRRIEVFATAHAEAATCIAERARQRRPRRPRRSERRRGALEAPYARASRRCTTHGRRCNLRRLLSVFCLTGGASRRHRMPQGYALSRWRRADNRRHGTLSPWPPGVLHCGPAVRQSRCVQTSAACGVRLRIHPLRSP
jgi:hypothetical protein